MSTSSDLDLTEAIEVIVRLRVRDDRLADIILNERRAGWDHAQEMVEAIAPLIEAQVRASDAADIESHARTFGGLSRGRTWTDAVEAAARIARGDS